MKPAVFDALRDAINALVMAQRASDPRYFHIYIKLAKKDIERAEHLAAQKESA